ncbi:unnamed protein product [Spodoptera littoralis]|uniref:Dynein heavy chain n=1 Tax=Spodoptera littoralis TaxID=7109 RepID=A0A9P0IHU7_SPOLI|nr:unnamed protein product [Spodoptera littoralis]CAH1647611.1 unnamed protein product [Spodoptera littoralis]
MSSKTTSVSFDRECNCVRKLRSAVTTMYHEHYVRTLTLHFHRAPGAWRTANSLRIKYLKYSCSSSLKKWVKRRCRMFPSLVNCCTIDWFTKWPPEALLSVAKQCLQPLGNPEIVDLISTMCVTMHQDVDVMTDRLYQEMRRYFYTTPSSYLDLLKLYLMLLDKKQQQIIRGRDRISCGLQKLYETYEVVGVMEQQVREMEPILAKKAEEGHALVAKLKVEQKAADQVKYAVMKDEAAAKIKAEEVKQIADEAKADLALAMPAMDAAQAALKALNKADINELKAFQKPPVLVRFVMEPICILFGAKPDWDSTKKLLADVNFIGKLEDYDKDHIPEATLKKLKVYLTHKDFNPDTVVKVSKVCRSMVLWVQAIDMYAKVFKVVEPKIINSSSYSKRSAVAERTPAFLPYVKEVTDRIEHLLRRKYCVRTIFSPPDQLRQLLRSPEDKDPLAVPGLYMIPCDYQVKKTYTSKKMDIQKSAVAVQSVHVCGTYAAHFIRFDKV